MDIKNNKKNSDARIKANTRYIDKSRATGKIKQLNLTLQGADYTIIDNYCKMHTISKAALITRAVRYCITHNIDLTKEQQNGGAAEDIGD